MQGSIYYHTRYGDLTPPMPRGLHFIVIRLLSPVGVCSLDGKPISDDIDRFAFNGLFHRMMRRTGKLHSLTLASVSLGIIASVSVSLWNFNTPEFRLWMDLIPQGFGIASMITTTLIVSLRASRRLLSDFVFLLKVRLQAMIANVAKEDIAVATGITYLFRTTGQVLGVSLSGALLQAILTKQLRKRITGPEAFEVRSTSLAVSRPFT